MGLVLIMTSLLIAFSCRSLSFSPLTGLSKNATRTSPRKKASRPYLPQYELEPYLFPFVARDRTVFHYDIVNLVDGFCQPSGDRWIEQRCILHLVAARGIADRSEPTTDRTDGPSRARTCSRTVSLRSRPGCVLFSSVLLYHCPIYAIASRLVD